MSWARWLSRPRAARPPAVRPALEVLEGRLVPSTLQVVVPEGRASTAVRVAPEATSNKASVRLQAPVAAFGFIGDSITAGDIGTASPPSTTFVPTYIPMGGASAPAGSNQGHDNASTADWLPGSGYLADAKAAFAAAGVRYVCVMIGVNDAAGGLSPAAYKRNLNAMCNNLVSAGYTVILNDPAGINPAGTMNGLGYNASALALMGRYLPQIDSLVNGTTILQGDKTAFTYFAQNVGDLQEDGVHPNLTGAAALGQMWASGAMRAIELQTSGGVNHPSANRVPRPVRVATGGVVILGRGLSIPDPAGAAGTLRVTLRASHGTFRLPSRSGLRTLSGNNTRALTLVGSRAAINRALGHVLYRPLGRFAGRDQVVLTSSDQVSRDTDVIPIIVSRH